MILEYHVYRKMTNGWLQLGQVRYEADARAMLEKWNAGYVSYKGDIIFKKGF